MLSLDTIIRRRALFLLSLVQIQAVSCRVVQHVIACYVKRHGTYWWLIVEKIIKIKIKIIITIIPGFSTKCPDKIGKQI